MDYQTLLDKIRAMFDWEYEESEGFDVTRFDYTVNNDQPGSLWVYKNGSLDGSAPVTIKDQISPLDKDNALQYF